jgi:hypothetical protein
MEAKPLKATPKETKQHICEVELQGLPNLTKKKNDEKLEKIIEVGTMMWVPSVIKGNKQDGEKVVEL